MFTQDNVVELCGLIIACGLVLVICDILMEGVLRLESWLWKRSQAKRRLWD